MRVSEMNPVAITVISPWKKRKWENVKIRTSKSYSFLYPTNSPTMQGKGLTSHPDNIDRELNVTYQRSHDNAT